MRIVYEIEDIITGKLLGIAKDRKSALLRTAKFNTDANVCAVINRRYVKDKNSSINGLQLHYLTIDEFHKGIER